MNFTTDKQSLDDLNLLGKYKSGSVYNLFNKTKTTGGEKLLENLFKEPLTEVKKINERSGIVKHFQQQNFVFPFKREEVEEAEQYIREGTESGLLVTGVEILRKKLSQTIFRSDEYMGLIEGMQSMIRVLGDTRIFLAQIKEGHDPFAEKTGKLRQLLSYSRIQEIIDDNIRPIEDKSQKSELEKSAVRVIRYHHLLQTIHKEELEQLFSILYELDVYVAVSGVAEEQGFNYARALEAEKDCFIVEGLRHPTLEKAVANRLALTRDKNVLFLTGANMAGKSTWMKTIGTNLYLAHLGMPVAAERLEFSVRDGLFSSINVPDDLSQGYSHFYAEVLRVKTVAEKVSEGKNLFVLFDELFKGTNVKDAYDATLAVTEAFAAYRNCLFVISTHIMEVGDALKERCDNIQYKYMPTLLEGTVPRYTYHLTEGISSDRQGMMIIENEGVLEIIKGEKM